MVEDYYIPLSALQHYAYCPRQYALIHIEQIWSENYWTMEGKILHERVDSGVSETRGPLRSERSVDVISHQLRITGKLDLLEITNTQPKQYQPVEYKRGKPKVKDWDRIQLCGQVLCLEEMLSTEIKTAALWYWQTRQREIVSMDQALRDKTLGVITEIHQLFVSGETPKANYIKRLCDACSLLDVCGVKSLAKDHSATFIEEIFSS